MLTLFPPNETKDPNDTNEHAKVVIIPYYADPSMYTRWRRPRFGGHPYQRTQPPAGQLANYMTPTGQFAHPGWMSVREVQSALATLDLQGSASHYTSKARLRHMKDGECMFVLLHSHWTVMICMSSCLIFFDPAGRSANHYFEGSLNHVHSLCVKVQPEGDVLCGNFCLFAAFALTKKMPRCSKPEIPECSYMFLARFLYFAPAPISTNAMLMTVFTYTFKLGEEFTEEHRYPKFQAFRQYIAN